MTVYSPWHSLMRRDYYHIYAECPKGKQIPVEERRHGLGGLKLCPSCRELFFSGYP